MIIKTLFIALAIMLVGCSRKPIITVPVKDSTNVQVLKNRVVETIQLAPDSALITAYFECDSNNRVLLRQVENLQGLRVTQEFAFNNGSFKIKATDKAEKDIEHTSKDSIIYTSVQVPYPVEVPIEVNKLTQWQIFQMWLGRIAMAFLAIWLITKRINNKLKSIFNFIKPWLKKEA